jgi:hypothetical protein
MARQIDDTHLPRLIGTDVKPDAPVTDQIAPAIQWILAVIVMGVIVLAFWFMGWLPWAG